MNPPPYESNRRSDYHSSTTLPPGEPNLTTYVPSYHTGLFKSAAPLPMPGETPPGYNEHSPIRELMMYVFEKGRMIIKEYKKLTSNSQLANIKNLGERVSECLDKIEQLYRNEPGLDAYLASKNKDGIKKKLMEIKMDLLHIQSSFGMIRQDFDKIIITSFASIADVQYNQEVMHLINTTPRPKNLFAFIHERDNERDNLYACDFAVESYAKSIEKVGVIPLYFQNKIDVYDNVTADNTADTTYEKIKNKLGQYYGTVQPVIFGLQKQPEKKSGGRRKRTARRKHTARRKRTTRK